MSLGVGPISQVSVGPTTASLSCVAASGGTSPYTYQWYRSTTSGFTPGGGNILTGKTALTLNDSGLVPGTTYYYVVKVTDVGNSNATADSAQFTLVTAAPTLSPNQFAQQPYLGTIDLRFPYNSVSVQIDASQASALYAGSAVKMYDSADGVPKVVGCTADSDDVLGFINFDIKTVQFTAGKDAEISMSGNVMYLYSTGAIARGKQVCLDLVTNGGVRQIDDATMGDNVVGWAYDKATAAGQLIRVFLKTPSFEYAS
jgi:hypothetical protein